jgi:class 3 adenylate cyclase
MPDSIGGRDSRSGHSRFSNAHVGREQRKLAAILVADIVGYSRLIGRDESGTLARLCEHRKARLEPVITR